MAGKRTTKYYELKRRVEEMKPRTQIQELLYNSLLEILETGLCRTGRFTKEGFEVWTALVHQYLIDHNIPSKAANDNDGKPDGWFIFVTMPAFLRDLKKENKTPATIRVDGRKYFKCLHCGLIFSMSENELKNCDEVRCYTCNRSEAIRLWNPIMQSVFEE